MTSTQQRGRGAQSRRVIAFESSIPLTGQEPTTLHQLIPPVGRHTSSVLAVAFSPEGEMVATGSSDGTAKVWGVRTGQELAVLVGHLDAVTAVAWADAGRLLVTGGADGSLMLWWGAAPYTHLCTRFAPWPLTREDLAALDREQEAQELRLRRERRRARSGTIRAGLGGGTGLWRGDGLRALQSLNAVGAPPMPNSPGPSSVGSALRATEAAPAATSPTQGRRIAALRKKSANRGSIGSRFFSRGSREFSLHGSSRVLGAAVSASAGRAQSLKLGREGLPSHKSAAAGSLRFRGGRGGSTPRTSRNGDGGGKLSGSPVLCCAVLGGSRPTDERWWEGDGGEWCVSEAVRGAVTQLAAKVGLPGVDGRPSRRCVASGTRNQLVVGHATGDLTVWDVSDSGTMELADLGDATLSALSHDCPVTAVACSADESLVVTGDADGGVRVWLADSWLPACSLGQGDLHPPRHAISHLSFALVEVPPSMRRVAARVAQERPGAEGGEEAEGEGESTTAVCVCAASNGTLWTWDVLSGVCERRTRLGSSKEARAVEAMEAKAEEEAEETGGGLFRVSQRRKRMRKADRSQWDGDAPTSPASAASSVMSAETGNSSHQAANEGEDNFPACVAPDGSFAAVSSNSSSALRVCDASAGSERMLYVAMQSVTAVACTLFSEVESVVACGDRSGAVHILCLHDRDLEDVRQRQHAAANAILKASGAAPARWAAERVARAVAWRRAFVKRRPGPKRGGGCSSGEIPAGKDQGGVVPNPCLLACAQSSLVAGRWSVSGPPPEAVAAGAGAATDSGVPSRRLAVLTRTPSSQRLSERVSRVRLTRLSTITSTVAKIVRRAGQARDRVGARPLLGREQARVGGATLPHAHGLHSAGSAGAIPRTLSRYALEKWSLGAVPGDQGVEAGSLQRTLSRMGSFQSLLSLDPAFSGGQEHMGSSHSLRSKLAAPPRPIDTSADTGLLSSATQLDLFSGLDSLEEEDDEEHDDVEVMEVGGLTWLEQKCGVFARHPKPHHHHVSRLPLTTRHSLALLALAASQFQRVRLGGKQDREAPAVTVPLSVHTVEQAHVVLQVLGLDPKEVTALICVLGGASGLHEVLVPRLRSLIVGGVARVAARRRAHVLDGGTDSGIMRMLGAGVESVRATAQWGEQGDATEPSAFIGVCPARCVRVSPGRSEEGEEDFGSLVAAVEAARDTSLVDLEPHHTHFVLADGRKWGSETGVMFALAAALAANAPAVAIVANGGSISRQEVLQAVRCRIPLLVLKGTGRLADELAIRADALAAGVDTGDFLHGINVSEVVEEDEGEGGGSGLESPQGGGADVSAVDDAVDTQDDADKEEAHQSPGYGHSRRGPGLAPPQLPQGPTSASQELEFIVREGTVHVFDMEAGDSSEFAALLERLLDEDPAAGEGEGGEDGAGESTAPTD